MPHGARSREVIFMGQIVTNLEIKLTLDPEKGIYQIDVYEPESGESASFEADKENIMEVITGKLGDEIISWCSLMEDKALDETREEERQ